MTPKTMAIISLVLSPLLPFDWLVAVGAMDVVVADVLDVVYLVEETREGVVDDCEGVNGVSVDDVVVEVGGGGGKEEGGIAC
jgi:hypothetical protein